MIKLDREKSYNRFEWHFIEQAHINASFPDKMIKVIMDMIEKSS